MADDFHKPTQFSGSKFESFQGGDDPASISRVAHETAQALLARVRSDPDPAVVERLVAYTDEHGIDAVAELWASATPRSLPGALWRIYLVRLLIRQDPHGTAPSSWPTRSYAGCSPATSPLPSIVRRRSAGWCRSAARAWRMITRPPNRRVRPN